MPRKTLTGVDKNLDVQIPREAETSLILALPAPEDEVEFAAMVVAAPALETQQTADEIIEIIIGSVMIRLAPATSARLIAAIAHELAETA